MADWDTDKPATNDIVSQFPLNEQAARSAVKTNFGIDHHETDDANVGKHETVKLVPQTTPTPVAGQGHFYAKDVGAGVIEIFYLDAAGNEVQLTRSGVLGNIPSGTKMLFQQTTAPTGWTKDTTHDNKALRVVTGAASSGGADSFTTVFGTAKGTDSHVLTEAEMPAHDHGSAGAHTHGVLVDQDFAGNGANSVVGSLDVSPEATVAGAAVSDGAHTHASAGGGGGHTHGISNLNLAFVDIIIATKD